MPVVKAVLDLESALSNLPLTAVPLGAITNGRDEGLGMMSMITTPLPVRQGNWRCQISIISRSG